MSWRRCALEQLEKSLLARARRCDAKEHIQKKDEGYCGTKEKESFKTDRNAAEKYSDRKENKTVTGFSYSVAVMTGKQLEAVLDYVNSRRADELYPGCLSGLSDCGAGKIWHRCRAAVCLYPVREGCRADLQDQSAAGASAGRPDTAGTKRN